MKLLGWMHRKFRQNFGDVVKEFPTGPACNCLLGRPTLDDYQLSPLQPPNHSHQMRDRHVLTDDYQLSSLHHSHPMRDRHMLTNDTLLFEGLLSIGTLGSGPNKEELEQEEEEEVALNSPSYEPMAVAVEEIAEKEENEATTETELMVVNAELEKVLIEAAEKEGDRLSSARPSHVSSGSKANEACPLQEYLLGSVAVAEVAEKERREKRASLGELFMIEEGGGKGEGKDGRDEGRGVNAMKKKMLLERHESNQGASQRFGGTGGGGGEGATANAKFHKILKMFHKKIHPEETINLKKFLKSSKSKNKDTVSSSTSADRGDPLIISPSKRTLRKETTSLKHGSDQPAVSLNGSDSTNNHGHWIKTDADYLVLEL